MHAEGGHLGTQRHFGAKQGYLGIASEVAWTQKEMRSSGEPCDVEAWKRDCPNFLHICDSCEYRVDILIRYKH